MELIGWLLVGAWVLAMAYQAGYTAGLSWANKRLDEVLKDHRGQP